MTAATEPAILQTPESPKSQSREAPITDQKLQTRKKLVAGAQLGVIMLASFHKQFGAAWPNG